MPIDNFESPPNWSVIKNFSEDSNNNLLYKGQLVGGSSGSTTTTQQTQILYADSNWSLVKGYSTNDVYWRSRENSSGEAATGKLEVGYFRLKNKLSMLIAGGGGSNGNLKSLEIVRVSDSAILSSYTLSNLIGSNSDSLVITTISTSNWIDSICFLRFKDDDPNSGWAWLGVDMSKIYCY